jgi:hypothetical protein
MFLPSREQFDKYTCAMAMVVQNIAESVFDFHNAVPLCMRRTVSQNLPLLVGSQFIIATVVEV